MEVKLFEIRDAGTFMPTMAIKLGARVEEERYLLARSGYGFGDDSQRDYVLFAKLEGGSGELNCDPYDWRGPARTMPKAHMHIIQNWSVLKSGDVIDVQYILGETPEAKQSEARDETFIG